LNWRKPPDGTLNRFSILTSVEARLNGKGMSLPLLTKFAPFAQDYDALLCDAWGVIHNGVTLTPGIEGALTRFRAERGPVIILTNAPRPSAIIPPQLDRLGLSRNSYDAVVTSGDATHAAIEGFLPAPAFRLGPEKDDALYCDLDITFATIDSAEFIVCTGLFDDQQEQPDEYRDLLKVAAGRKIPMVCANPDIVVNWGGRIVYCAGALAEIYAELGGDVIYGGKPHRPIYDLAMKEIEKAAGIRIPKSRVLAVGDSIKTDIGGANAQGIDALLVAGANGIHGEVTTEESILTALEEAGAQAAAAMETLTW